MKTKNIEPILRSIRDKYERIKQMTETLDIDSDPVNCIKIIEQRSCIFLEIEDEKSLLEKDCSQWQKLCENNPVLKKVRGEIQLLIATAIALDSITQDKLAGRMEKVRCEISDLGRTSRAALSYARHKA